MHNLSIYFLYQYTYIKYQISIYVQKYKNKNTHTHNKSKNKFKPKITHTKLSPSNSRNIYTGRAIHINTCMHKYVVFILQLHNNHFSYNTNYTICLFICIYTYTQLHFVYLVNSMLLIFFAA